jgi:hypothetical protein
MDINTARAHCEKALIESKNATTAWQASPSDERLTKVLRQSNQAYIDAFIAHTVSAVYMK